MKTLILFGLGVVLLSACGSSSSSPAATGACASSLFVGSWAGSVAGNADVMTLNADCTASSLYCVASFTYPNVTTTSGNAAIKTISTSGKTGCAPVGDMTCGYVLSNSNNTLAFSCTAGTLTYTRQ